MTCARVQGHNDNIKRLKNSPVMSQLSDHPDWLPLLFDESGILSAKFTGKCSLGCFWFFSVCRRRRGPNTLLKKQYLYV